MRNTMKEETFIHPANGLLYRRFNGCPVVVFNQKRDLVIIDLNYLRGYTRPAVIVDTVNRAMIDFNLPGTLYFKGAGQYTMTWIKIWNWKDFNNGIQELSLHEKCGPDPLEATALGIKEPDNDYETISVPISLSREDWVEIYYALDSKIIHIGEYNQVKKEQTRWAKHLKRIIDKIGPEGDIASASGVEANV